MDLLNRLLDILMPICFGGCGMYCIYTSIVMGSWTELRPNKLIYPNACTPENCLDPEGFIRFQRPRTMIGGILCMITAALCTLMLLVEGIPAWVGPAAVVCGIVAFVLLIVMIRQSYNRFW